MTSEGIEHKEQKITKRTRFLISLEKRRTVIHNRLRKETSDSALSVGSTFPRYCSEVENANGCVFFSSQVQLHECRHKGGKELDLRLRFYHGSLTKAERGKGVEPVCKGMIRMIDSGIKVEYGMKWGEGL